MICSYIHYIYAVVKFEAINFFHVFCIHLSLGSCEYDYIRHPSNACITNTPKMR